MDKIVSADRGGRREGSGRKPKLTTSQMLWLKRRYAELMAERAKERALRHNLPLDRIDGDLDELRELHDELRTIPICERKSWEARELQSRASEIIGRRIVRPGSGRGPTLNDEPTAAQIRTIVAKEARRHLGRKDITPRLVQTACAMQLSDGEIVLRWMLENDV